jgi:hypothetical protein
MNFKQFRQRADCADFFVTSKLNKALNIQMPTDLFGELEREAALLGRTWNEHTNYIMRILLGHLTPDFDDARTVEDWRTRMSPCMFQLTEGGEWIPFTVIGASHHEHEAISETRQHAQ